MGDPLSPGLELDVLHGNVVTRKLEVVDGAHDGGVEAVGEYLPDLPLLCLSDLSLQLRTHVNDMDFDPKVGQTLCHPGITLKDACRNGVSEKEDQPTVASRYRIGIEQLHGIGHDLLLLPDLHWSDVRPCFAEYQGRLGIPIQL